MTKYNKLTLDKISTRKLLDTYKSSRYHMDDNIHLQFQQVIEGGIVIQEKFNLSEIKAELDKREHVPSKLEGKLLRKLMAKHKMNESEIRKRFILKRKN